MGSGRRNATTANGRLSQLVARCKMRARAHHARDSMRAPLPLAITLLLMAGPAAAQSDAPSPAPPVPSIQGYGDHDPSCTRWTDTCRTCERSADNVLHCSNIGIACQPAEVTCTARQPPPDPPKSDPPK